MEENMGSTPITLNDLNKIRLDSTDLAMSEDELLRYVGHVRNSCLCTSFEDDLLPKGFQDWINFKSEIEML